MALFDPTFNAPEEGFAAALDAHRPRLAVVCEDDFNFLSKMCLGRNRELAFSMAAAARDRGVPIAAHGSDASDHVLEYLDAGFDSVLIGEVETTLVELAEGRPRASIRGLAYRDGLVRSAQRAARTSHRFGHAPSARLGSGRYGSVPAGLAGSARLFLVEHGLQPRMPVSMQLVRQADLRQSLSCAPACIRRGGDALFEGQISAGPHLVRRRYFRALAQVDAGFRRCGGASGRAGAVQDAVALRSDDARHAWKPCAAPDARKYGWAPSPDRNGFWTPWTKARA